MTKNQLNYAELKERQRANLAQEQETRRANMARESLSLESNRIAAQQVALGYGNLKNAQARLEYDYWNSANTHLTNNARNVETTRHNQATEVETGRHNVASERTDTARVAGSIFTGLVSSMAKLATIGTTVKAKP